MIPLRQRLWRWLDQKQRFGFTVLDSKSLSAVMTLATLAEEAELKRLATLVMYLQIFEIQSSYWQVGNLRCIISYNIFTFEPKYIIRVHLSILKWTKIQ